VIVQNVLVVTCTPLLICFKYTPLGFSIGTFLYGAICWPMRDLKLHDITPKKTYKPYLFWI